MFYSEDPYTGKKWGVYDSVSLDQSLDLTRKAHAAQVQWGHLPLTGRMSWLEALSSALRGARYELARTMAMEMGKPLTQGMAEVDKCLLLCAYYRDQAPITLSHRVIESPSLQAEVHYRPLGLVLGIMPWNFPYWQTLRFAIPAILAGNAVMVKPAPRMPGSALALQAIMTSVLGNAHLYQTLLADVDTLPALLEEGGFSGLALTGSDRAGVAVATMAARHLIPVVLELGGADAFIVLEDADVDRAAGMAVLSRMTNNGQTCIAAKRILVHASLEERFVKAMRGALAALPKGSPLETASFMTCLARTDLAADLESQVNDAVLKGATLIPEDNQGHAPATHFAPRLVCDVRPGMRLWEEEVFGPVAVVRRFESTEEAIEMANDSKYGLGASVWSSRPETARNVAERLQCGVVVINGIVRSDPRLPFGGIKRSGYGRELGPEGLLSFCNVQSWITDA